jgi:SOS-response transcriptional repressor LexA
LKTIKDWINADLETWDKVIKKQDDESYIIKVSGEDMETSYSKRIKNTDKS